MQKKKSKEGSNSGTTFASANWLALRRLPQKSSRKAEPNEDGPRKRRKVKHAHSPSSSPAPTKSLLVSRSLPPQTPRNEEQDLKNGESFSGLRKMIFGQIEYTENQELPGKYLALDCEMVGIGIDGAESSLARVSLVNFYGAIQLDEFVRQKERVVDYRTRFSGIRESDMIKAKPFNDVQKQVADLLKDRILVGHAVFNDLKALLLSHPRQMTRDTQCYAGKYKVSKSKYVALRNLVKQELDVTIQDGEHSSVTDARATMAVYRLHRRDWEKGNKPLMGAGKKSDKDKHVGEEDKTAKGEEFPGGGKKGISSGLTTIVRRGSTSGGEKRKWWKELGSGGSKGSLKI